MFSENYSVCLNDDGSPREIQRNGPVVTYKAIGYETGRMVAMQLIPLASMDEVERVRFEENARTAQKLDHINLARVFDVGIEHDHLVLVSEYLEGETAESWIRAHGPMPADAVLRIGLQVMNALTAVATQTLTHRSIQPANVIILPGVASDGGWPGIKLLNFGFSGLKVRSEDDQMHEIVPSVPSQFASPEQLENGIVDFRSDIFSLGATMWFLLTGAAPSPAAATESGPRLSTSVGAVPRFVRNLVSRMLRTHPEERPQNPATLGEKIHACLQKAERQTAFTRSFAPAAIPTLPRAEKKRVAPALALAASVAVLASLGAFYFVRSQRESKPLGVIIGVPEAVEASSLLVGAPSTPSPVISSAAGQSGLVAQQSPTQATASPAGTSVTADKLSSSPQLAANNRMAEPPAPAEGPSETNQGAIDPQPPLVEKNESPPADMPDRTATAANESVPTASSPNQSPDSSERVVSRKRADSTVSRTRSLRKRMAKSSERPLPPLRIGETPARFVGTTSGGKWVLRLPSGETIVTPPVPNIDDAPVISHRRVRRVLRPIPLQDESPVMVLPPDF